MAVHFIKYDALAYGDNGYLSSRWYLSGEKPATHTDGAVVTIQFWIVNIIVIINIMTIQRATHTRGHHKNSVAK